MVRAYTKRTKEQRLAIIEARFNKLKERIAKGEAKIQRLQDKLGKLRNKANVLQPVKPNA